MSSQYRNEPPTSGKVILHTTVGEIEIELWSKEAPLACRNFVQLCMEGYYNGTIFHRVVRDFIIQGGDPTGTGKGGESIYGQPFKDEFHQRLRFNRRGLLGMANAGPNDNGSQFFFTLNGSASLDKKHTLFGQVVGPTVFNMLRIIDCDIDEDERPKKLNKITGAEIINNPFKDIVPREKVKEKKKEKKPVKKEVVKKNLNLLSFGDEAEEDEAELEVVNKKLNTKGKSAHDVLKDDKLSTQVAVTKDEFEDYEPDDNVATEETVSDSLNKIRAKFQKRKKQQEDGEQPLEEEKDIDFERMLEEQRREEESTKLTEMKAELKSMQKEYMKAIRGPKQKKQQAEEEQSDAMKMYSALKFKFQDKSKHLLTVKDPQREAQTMSILERFTTKLKDCSQSDILHDKKKIAPKRKLDEAGSSADGEEKQFGIDLDAEDTYGTDWMKHKFVAEDEDPALSKAKDANTKDSNDDWYTIEDPRNAINKRRRGEQ